MDRLELEEEPFLDSIEKGRTSPRKASLRRQPRLLVGFMILQVLLIAIYTAGSAYYIHRTTAQSVTASDFSSGLSGLNVEFERRKYIAYQNSPYSGSPGGSNDDAWNHLISNTTVRVSDDELKIEDRKSLKLPNGGYMAMLGVYHELHCLHMIRKNLFNGISSLEGTEAEKQHEIVHANHCIELLRASTTCRADSSLITFKWSDKGNPMPDLQRPIHTCVNWQSFTDSLQDRFVNEDELYQLIHSHQ